MELNGFKSAVWSPALPGEVRDRSESDARSLVPRDDKEIRYHKGRRIAKAECSKDSHSAGYPILGPDFCTVNNTLRSIR
jgi:hypothetical protein